MMNIDSHQEFSRRVRNRQEMLGAFCSAPCPELVEIAAFAGFDFAVIDAEHGPIAIGDIAHMVRAGHAAGMPVMARIPASSLDMIPRALDLGIDGILAPQIDTAQEAAAVVAATRYPPSGNRGVAFYTRAHRFTKDTGPEAIERADERIVVGVMVESERGVQNADAIMSVPGVDMVLVGPNDLAASIGYATDTQRLVDEAVALVGKAGLRHRIATAIAAQSPESAISFLDQGYSIVVTGLLPPLLRVSTAFVRETRSGSSR